MTEAAIMRILYPPAGSVPVEHLDAIPEIRSHIAALLALTSGRTEPRTVKMQILRNPVESAQITQQIVQLKDDGSGRSWPEIARLVGHGLTGNACQHRYSAYMRKQSKEQLHHDTDPSGITQSPSQEPTALHPQPIVPQEDDASPRSGPNQSGSTPPAGQEAGPVQADETLHNAAELQSAAPAESVNVHERSQEAAAGTSASPSTDVGPRPTPAQQPATPQQDSSSPSEKDPSALTQVQKDRILELHEQGCTLPQIQYETGIKDGRRIHGVIMGNKLKKLRTLKEAEKRTAQPENVEKRTSEPENVATDQTPKTESAIEYQPKSQAIESQSQPDAQEEATRSMDELSFSERSELDQIMWGLYRQKLGLIEITQRLHEAGYAINEGTVRQRLRSQGAII